MQFPITITYTIPPKDSSVYSLKELHPYAAKRPTGDDTIIKNGVAAPASSITSTMGWTGLVESSRPVTPRGPTCGAWTCVGRRSEAYILI